MPSAAKKRTAPSFLPFTRVTKARTCPPWSLTTCCEVVPPHAMKSGMVQSNTFILG